MATLAKPRLLVKEPTINGYTLMIVGSVVALKPLGYAKALT